MLFKSSVISACGPQNAVVGRGRTYSTEWLTFISDADILNQMVENELDTIFHALADPTRRGMLANLALGEKSIGELAQPFAMSFAGASKHVKVLGRRRAGCAAQGRPDASLQSRARAARRSRALAPAVGEVLVRPARSAGGAVEANKDETQMTAAVVCCQPRDRGSGRAGVRRLARSAAEPPISCSRHRRRDHPVRDRCARRAAAS